MMMEPSNTVQCRQIGICGIDAGDVHGDVLKCESGETFRYIMSAEPATRCAIVGNDINDVDPLNLVAALKKDNPERKVMTLDSNWGLSFSVNAEKAGVDQAISEEELEQIIGACVVEAEQDLPDTSAAAERVPQVDSTVQSSDSGICMSVVSGRGGVGKSTLCLLLAMVAESKGIRTTVLDMDMQFGDLGYLCNQDRSFSLLGYGLGGLDLDEKKLDASKILVLYPIEKPEYSEVMSKKVRDLIDGARRCSDLVIVNTGSSWSDLNADIVEWSDVVVFVMDQRATSVRGCRAARDLCIRMGIPSSKFCFVLNRCTGSGQISVYDCALSLGVDVVHEVPDGGAEVEEALSLGIPSTLMDVAGPLVESIGDILSATMSRFGLKIQEPAPRSGGGAFKGLFGRKAGR